MRILKTLEGLLNSCTRNDELGCLEWNYSRMPKGYGKVRIGKKMELVHRRVYQLSHPDEDITDLKILHKCDNPPCCNPEHLFSGTNQDNMDDMKSKGREIKPGPKKPQKGERHSNAKLSDAEVTAIREIYAVTPGVTQSMLGIFFGVSVQHISRLINRTRRDFDS